MRTSISTGITRVDAVILAVTTTERRADDLLNWSWTCTEVACCT